MKSARKESEARITETGLPAWERPAIVSREQLEVIAAVCSPGKGPTDPLPDCLLNSNS